MTSVSVTQNFKNHLYKKKIIVNPNKVSAVLKVTLFASFLCSNDLLLRLWKKSRIFLQPFKNCIKIIKILFVFSIYFWNKSEIKRGNNINTTPTIALWRGTSFYFYLNLFPLRGNFIITAHLNNKNITNVQKRILFV